MKRMLRSDLCVTFLILVILAWVASLHGCAQMGMEQPKSFADRLAYAEGSNTALRDASTDALDHREISSKDMEHVIAINTQAKTLLLAARTAMTTDIATAEGKLLAATKLLAELQTYLRARGVKTSFNFKGGVPWENLRSA